MIEDEKIVGYVGNGESFTPFTLTTFKAFKEDRKASYATLEVNGELVNIPSLSLVMDFFERRTPKMKYIPTKIYEQGKLNSWFEIPDRMRRLKLVTNEETEKDIEKPFEKVLNETEKALVAAKKEIESLNVTIFQQNQKIGELETQLSLAITNSTANSANKDIEEKGKEAPTVVNEPVVKRKPGKSSSKK
jgi:hypothetical protein